MKFSYELANVGFLFCIFRLVAARPQPAGVLLQQRASISATPSKTTATSYPTPTVPIGAGGGPFATVSGRMFNIQSKTQFFAGNYDLL